MQNNPARLTLILSDAARLYTHPVAHTNPRIRPASAPRLKRQGKSDFVFHSPPYTGIL